MCDCTPKCRALKLLVLGAILVLVRLYTIWDIVLVAGVLLILKAILMFAMPVCPVCSKIKKKK